MNLTENDLLVTNVRHRKRTEANTAWKFFFKIVEEIVWQIVDYWYLFAQYLDILRRGEVPANPAVKVLIASMYSNYEHFCDIVLLMNFVLVDR